MNSKSNIHLLVLLLALVAGCDPKSNEAPQADFVAAVAANDTAKALPLLAQYPSMAMANDPSGTPVLNVAISHGNVELVTAILKAGADPNGGGSSRPLLVAMTSQPNRDIIAALLEHGANVNIVDSQGITPLMKAADAGDVQTVQLLGGKGADVNALDNVGGRTVLHHAVYGANAGVVKFLVEKGASLSTADAEGLTAVQLAEAIDKLKKDTEFFAENAHDPAAAIQHAPQKSVRAAVGQPAQSKDLSEVIETLQKAAGAGVSR